jgi:hypothetical protein
MKGTFTRLVRVKVPFMRLGMGVRFPSRGMVTRRPVIHNR